MNHISKAILAAALGSSLLALEACRKWDTNRLAGRWRLVGGDIFSPNQGIIYEFEKDGDFTEERTLQTFNGYGYYYAIADGGDWKWSSGKKLEIDRSTNYDIEFDVILIKGNDMELKDELNRDWIFKKE